MEGEEKNPMFGPQWNVQMFRGQQKEKKKHRFHLLSLFIPKIFLSKLHSPLTYAFILPQF